MGRVLHCLLVICLLCPFFASAQTSGQNPTTNGGDFSAVTNPTTKVPKDVILVKGAWSSASDTVTPVPEASTFDAGTFRNQYFGIIYAIPPGWERGYDGPPPSDSGRYVIAELRASDPHKELDPHKETSRAGILITAQDMFFSPQPVENALEFLHFSSEHLQPDYREEEPPTPTKIAGRPFVFFAYESPVAQLHWYVAATEIRCHALEIVLTSGDPKLLGNLLLDLDKMKLPAEADPTKGTGGGEFPVCLKDYARDGNLVAKVDPVFTERHGNVVPVRVIIDKNGTIKHIHFLSAFPDQAKAITDALAQWRFKPYLRDGHPVEVETGIMFGGAIRASTPRKAAVE